MRSKRSPGSSASKRSECRTRTRSATPCSSALRRVFSTAATLMSSAVTAAQPDCAAVTAVTPAPAPTSRKLPPSGYGIQLVSSSVETV